MHTLSDIADIITAELRGDPDCQINGVGSLLNAEAGHISFLSEPSFKKHLATTRASAVIMSGKDVEDCPTHVLLVDNPYLAYAKVAALFQTKSHPKPGIHPSAVIGEHCQIDDTASIGPLCVIEDNVIIGKGSVIGSGCVIGEASTLGEACTLWANVSIHHRTQIGNNVIIHSSAVIGGDGFGNANDGGKWFKVPQLGRVIIGDDVEIGSNTSIDRGVIDDTIIHDGVRLDNLIQIAHNVDIGENTAIAAGAAIAGSTKIGKNCMFGGGCNIIGHINITDNVYLAGATTVPKSIDKPGIYASGIMNQPVRQWMKNMFRLHQLDELFRRVGKIEKKLGTRT